MKLFLDTADVSQIRQALDWGILDGVTTNPTHVSKTGRPFSEVAREIVEMVDGPISLETVGLSAEEILREAEELSAMHSNVVVKVPLMEEGLKAVKKLSAKGIKTNVTVTFSALQALLAAKCGANYISPFVGRLDAVGHRGMEVVEQIRRIYTNYGFETQILAAALRHPIHVLEAALAGADVCTMSFDVMQQLYRHPLTDAGIELFLKDWEKVPKG